MHDVQRMRMTHCSFAKCSCGRKPVIIAMVNTSGMLRGGKQMKSVTAHILEYTLRVHFAGNKSECARKLSIRRPDFNRIYDRCIHEEGSSLKVIEGILLLYCTEGYSLDEAMEGYISASDMLTPLSAARPTCAGTTDMIRERIQNASIEADRRAQVLRSASQFLTQLERAFCTEACQERARRVTDCPCQQFCQFVEKLDGQLKMPNGSSASQTDTTQKDVILDDLRRPL